MNLVKVIAINEALNSYDLPLNFDTPGNTVQNTIREAAAVTGKLEFVETKSSDGSNYARKQKNQSLAIHTRRESSCSVTTQPENFKVAMEAKIYVKERLPSLDSHTIHQAVLDGEHIIS